MVATSSCWKSILELKAEMDQSLTLQLDAALIEEAKLYVEKRGISLSKLVENYLVDTLAKDADEITPLVKSLIGVASLPEGIDWKEEVVAYLMEKHQ